MSVPFRIETHIDLKDIYKTTTTKKPTNLFEIYHKLDMPKGVKVINLTHSGQGTPEEEIKVIISDHPYTMCPHKQGCTNAHKVRMDQLWTQCNYCMKMGGKGCINEKAKNMLKVPTM